jgi:hypothetical protein
VTDTVTDISRGYLELRWHLDPVRASAAGVREHDGAYARYDVTSVREALAALRSYTSALEEAEADSLDAEIDRTALLHDARRMLLVLERERPFASNPALHLAHGLEGLAVLLGPGAGDAAHAARALVERLTALPALLRAGVEALTEPAAPLIDLAAEMLPAGLAFVRDALDESALGGAAVDPAEFAQARDAAVVALIEYGDALVLMRERARATYAAGRELFDRMLHTAHMIRENADELLRFGERLRGEALAMLQRASAEIAPGRDWHQVLATLRADTVPPHGEVSALEGAITVMRERVAREGLLHLPAAELRVVETPEALRPIAAPVAYRPPADALGHGVLLVTPPESGARRGGLARAEVASVAAREGVPGAHVQIATARALPSPVRRALITAEGSAAWAGYAEWVMAESDALGSSEERFFHAYRVLRSAVRLLLDIVVHTKGVSVAAAADRMESELGLSPAEALVEARRCCANPTLGVCEAVGRRELLALREDVRRERGAAFSLGAFHDELLRYGALPTALARWGMGVA